MVVAARTVPLRSSHLKPVIPDPDPEPMGGGPIFADTNRSTRRPITVFSRRIIQEPSDVASDLKFPLQADYHVAARLRRGLTL